MGRRLLFSLKQCPAKIMQTNRRKPAPKVDRQHQKLGPSLSHLGEDVPSNVVVLRFTISKKIDEKWGINVVGGKGSISHNIYVKDVQFGSVCARDGQLLNGDCVLEVNGEDMTTKTHSEAIQVFRRYQTILDIVVSRMTVSQLKETSCNYASSISRYDRIGQMDDEPVVMEHKEIPNNYTATIW